MVDWSDDRIAALSDQDLKNLLVNAERKSAADVIAQCKAEMEKRDAAKPRKASKPRTELKEFEHDMSAQLADGRQGDGREIRPLRRNRESKIGWREGISIPQASGCQGLCKAWRASERRDGRGRSLHLVPARQRHRDAGRLAVEGCSRSRTTSFMSARRPPCSKAARPSPKSARASREKDLQETRHIRAFKDLPSAAAAFDAALAKITA